MYQVRSERRGKTSHVLQCIVIHNCCFRLKISSAILCMSLMTASTGPTWAQLEAAGPSLSDYVTNSAIMAASGHRSVQKSHPVSTATFIGENEPASSPEAPGVHETPPSGEHHDPMD
jgi:hypothetical protein